MTQDERVNTVANMLFVNRFAAMNGETPPFNHEAMLVVLIAPDWFIAVGGGETVKQMLGGMAETEQLWAAVQADIERMFPNNFDWENQRRKAASV